MKDSFFWGSATAAHQVEGGNRNDWTKWEKENAPRLASLARGKQWPDYILKNYPSPLQEENYISGKACDHYNRFREDFDIAKKLGHNAHRFSIEWSRVEPEEGKFNAKEIEHYREVIHALRERGLEPFATLWHWTHPLWFTERGGWTHKDAEKSFLRFVEVAVKAFPEINYWIVLNEPETFVRHGYLLKPFGMARPPGKFNPLSAYRALQKLTRTYKSSYQLIRKVTNGKAKVGFAESLVYFESYSRWPQNIILKNVLEWWRNKLFVPKVVNSADFIGLNYYFHTRVRFNLLKSRWGIQFNDDKIVSDIHWEIYPEGIYHILKNLKKYNKPIFITENGVVDARDIYRADFIKDHIKYVHRAASEGADVRGYFYWSLLDNFEWNEGFWPRFGLVEIDYKTMERKIRPSALEYKKIIESGNLSFY